MRDETDPFMWSCSGILVTLTHVLTAYHCLWAHKKVNQVFNETGESDKYTKNVSTCFKCRHVIISYQFQVQRHYQAPETAAVQTENHNDRFSHMVPW